MDNDILQKTAVGYYVTLLHKACTCKKFDHTL